MQLIIRILIATLAVFIAAYILPGVEVADFPTSIIVAIVLGVINSIIRPILLVLTLPVTIITFGLFTFVINALLILFVSWLVPGFEVAGFLWALLFSLVVSLVSWFLQSLR